MKLRGKIILLLDIVVFVIISFIGFFAYTIQQKSINTIIEDNLTDAARTNAHDVQSQFILYKKIVGVVGQQLSNFDEVQRSGAVGQMAESFGFTSGNVLDVHGVSLSDGNDYSDREYVQRALMGEIVISDVSLSKLTGKNGISVAGPLYDKETGLVNGVVYFRMDIDSLLEVVSAVSLSENSNAYIVNGRTGYVIVHEDQELINNLNVVDIGDFSSELSDIANNPNGFVEYEFNDEMCEGGYAIIGGTDGWILVVSAPVTDFTGELENLKRMLLVMELIAIIVTGIFSIILAQFITGPVINIKNSLVKLAEGDFSAEIKHRKGKDEIAQLVQASESLQESIVGVVSEANEILGKMSQYDLTSADMKVYPGEFNSMSESVNGIKLILNQMIKNVQEAVANVGTGAGEIADATNALSEGTLAQASSIQQAVVDIEQVAAQTEKNSENGAVVNEKLQHLDQLIKESNVQMQELRAAVLEVEEMSEDIQKIVNDIDSISFQTNILALNASVEAARAGENGKGFAVVADEVGNLANKSGDSSKKTADLIEKCITSIAKAKKCADKTFDSLNEIVSNSEEISTAFVEITVANEEQAENTKSIKGEITKISDVVQTNTATAQQTAASTQVLSGEADNLNALIRNFKV